MEQTDSQAMLEYLEQTNLFVVSLDDKRQWYRYHALFAETLSHQLQQRHIRSCSSFAPSGEPLVCPASSGNSGHPACLSRRKSGNGRQI